MSFKTIGAPFGRVPPPNWGVWGAAATALSPEKLFSRSLRFLHHQINLGNDQHIRLSGNINPGVSYSSTSHVLTASFRSDSSVQRKGFSARFIGKYLVKIYWENIYIINTLFTCQF